MWGKGRVAPIGPTKAVLFQTSLAPLGLAVVLDPSQGFSNSLDSHEFSVRYGTPLAGCPERPGSWSQLNPGIPCPGWVQLSPTRPQVWVSPLRGDLGKGLMLEQTFIAIVSIMLLLGKPPQSYLSCFSCELLVAGNTG